MSEYYNHFLIASSPTFRPSSQSVVKCINTLVRSQHIPAGLTIKFSKIMAGEPRFREVKRITGETFKLRRPTRFIESSIVLQSPEDILNAAGQSPEFDISISGSETPPARPPLEMGYRDNGQWKRITGSFHSEFRLRVRAKTVRLSVHDSEAEIAEMNRPINPGRIPDFTPRFDEDCQIPVPDGLFLHPELGVLRIPGAGCAMFWIEFNYGKFIWPQHRNGAIDVLSEGVVKTVDDIFGITFVQACDWK